MPFWIIPLPLRMLFHAKDPFPSFASRMLPVGKKFALKNLWSRESSFVSKRHNCFSSIVSLKFCRSLKPMPPKLFSLHKVLHLDQWIFLCSPRRPHQNFLIKDSISAKGDWEFETTHGISRDCLDDHFEKHFLACLEKELLFPPLKFCPNPFLDVPKTCSLVFPN